MMHGGYSLNGVQNELVINRKYETQFRELQCTELILARKEGGRVSTKQLEAD
jgi:hypothetical protein